MILTTKDLTKTFIRQGKEFQAVDHADFCIHSGEICVLTGPSGCGKSTFFHLICGITGADGGEILFEGKDLCKAASGELALVRAEKISYIMQGDSLLPNLTVMENICLPHYLCGTKKGLETRAAGLLEEFGLNKMADEYPSNLSGGERRRVAIARAFVHAPVLVVADEPTSDLDEENTSMIMDHFEKQAASGTAILISTHDHSCLRDGMTHYVMNSGVMKVDKNQ